jgi:hypothetical protein
MNKKTIKTTETQEQQITEKPAALNVELGKIKAKANNFWIAIAFLIAFTICFITYCICQSVTHVTEQYFKNLTELSMEYKK